MFGKSEEYDDEYIERVYQAKLEYGRRLHHKRNQMIFKLKCEVQPSTMFMLVKERYGSTCLITESEDIAIDHFIPLSWGLLGNVWGNLFPISKSINSCMQNSNPFEWVKSEKTLIELDIDINRWHKFICLGCV